MLNRRPVKRANSLEGRHAESRLFKRRLFLSAALAMAFGAVIVLVGLSVRVQREEKVRRDVVAYGGIISRKCVQTEWLGELARSTGFDELSPIDTVFLRSPREIPGRVFDEIGTLPNLRILTLGGASCNDNSLQSLIGNSKNNSSRLETLKMLRLDDSRVTNEGVRRLKALSSLEILLLTNAEIDDNALQFIAELRSLRWLWLRSTRISGNGLEWIDDLRLEHLFLDNTLVESVHCQAIARIDCLVVLNLDNTCIDDSCLLLLKGMKNLSVLCIRNTQVTDDGLDSLQEMESLRFLNLVGSDVTREGALKLKRAKPELRIDLLKEGHWSQEEVSGSEKDKGS